MNEKIILTKTITGILRSYVIPQLHNKTLRYNRFTVREVACIFNMLQL